MLALERSAVVLSLRVVELEEPVPDLIVDIACALTFLQRTSSPDTLLLILQRHSSFDVLCEIKRIFGAPVELL